MTAAAWAQRGGRGTTQTNERTEGALINVTMEGAAIRIRPVGHLDAEMAATIRQLLDSARTAGTQPVLDVSGLVASDRAAAMVLDQVTTVEVA